MTELQKQRITKMRTCGDSYSKIAATLDISENTVKSFCRRNNLAGNMSMSTKTIESATEPTPVQDETRCRQCGQELEQQPKKKMRKFCCDKCCAAWWAANPEKLNRKATYSFACACCGVKFTAYGNKGRKYCTHACYVAGRFGRTVAV